MNDHKPMTESLHHICGIGELGLAPLAAARRVVSILDPAAEEPPELRNLSAKLLVLRFDDVIIEDGPLRAPVRADIEALLAFDRGHQRGDSLVIHCTAGISRSTAALAILLAQREPNTEPAIFAELRAVRPKAWPNSLMIAFADDVLGAKGRLKSALREHYKIQLRAHPDVGRMMIGLGREREVPFERLRP